MILLMFSMKSLDCSVRVYASDRYKIMNLFSTTAGQCIWNTGIQGAGLKGGNNMSAQSEPQRADP